LKQEAEFNSVLGAALEKSNPAWRGCVIVEETGVLAESAGLKPDVLIVHKSSPPISIETSFLAGDADQDALARLGKHYESTMEEIKTSISVELKPAFRKVKRLTGQRLQYAVHQLLPGGAVRRFPKTGFIEGTHHDLARIAQAPVPKEDIEAVANGVAKRVKAAAECLEAEVSKKSLTGISSALYQRSAVTGLRTTAILWLNAMLVQRMLVGGVHGIPKISHVPSECVDAWKKIRGINWRAIFEPAVPILDDVRKMAPGAASGSLAHLEKAVEMIDSAKLGSEINVGAELFPLISDDRKQSAAFYTQPATAEFLAALAMPEDVDSWDQDTFDRLKIADLACGTGTLLRFGYRQAKIYHERRGTKKTLEKLHRTAMEKGLYGADVSPIAAHLTSSSLAVASKQPYGKTNVGWVGVGSPNMTGSIEYIGTEAVQDRLFGAAGTGGSAGGEKASRTVKIEDRAMSVILMNPPYSRTRGGQSAFDIAGLTDKERDACQERWGKLIKGEPCIKTAGMAPTFLCAAHKKLKPGGRAGFVLPRTAAFADTWTKTRDMVETEYKDITAVAVSSALGREAMSADTDMEEMVLVATKKARSGGARSPVRCVTLYEPMTRVGEAAEIARAVQNSGDGPIVLGGDEIGVSSVFRTNGGAPWSAVGVVNTTLDRIKNGMLAGVFENADGTEAGRVPMTTIGKLFDVGPTHDRIGHPAGGDPRGAFTFHPVVSDIDAVGMHRSLWKVYAKLHKSMIAKPTHKGTIYRKEKAAEMWDTRSSLFYGKGPRWTTQSLVAAMTESEIMGGNAWVSLRHDDCGVLKAFALWANSIYGMVTYWALGSRTHQGRSMLKVRAIKKVQCPDFDALNTTKAARQFDRLSKKTLKAAYLAGDDPVRTRINEAVSEMLGVPGYDAATLTRLWCDEPSVKKLKRG